MGMAVLRMAAAAASHRVGAVKNMLEGTDYEHSPDLGISEAVIKKALIANRIPPCLIDDLAPVPSVLQIRKNGLDLIELTSLQAPNLLVASGGRDPVKTDNREAILAEVLQGLVALKLITPVKNGISAVATHYAITDEGLNVHKYFIRTNERTGGFIKAFLASAPVKASATPSEPEMISHVATVGPRHQFPSENFHTSRFALLAKDTVIAEGEAASIYTRMGSGLPASMLGMDPVSAVHALLQSYTYEVPREPLPAITIPEQQKIDAALRNDGLLTLIASGTATLTEKGTSLLTGLGLALAERKAAPAASESPELPVVSVLGR